MLLPVYTTELLNLNGWESKMRRHLQHNLSTELQNVSMLHVTFHAPFVTAFPQRYGFNDGLEWRCVQLVEAQDGVGKQSKARDSKTHECRSE